MKARVFTFFIYVSAIFVLCFLVASGYRVVLVSLIFWALLSAVTESLGVELPNGEQISVSVAITIATIITGGPLTAAIVSGLGFVFRVLKEKDGKYYHALNTAAYKTIFNTSQGVIASGLSGLAYVLIQGPVGKFSIGPTLFIIPVYIALNSIILAKMISLLTNKRFFTIWFNNIRYIFLSLIVVGSVGIVIALAYLSYGPMAVLLFFGPLLLARFSFKLYIDMRSLYIETIQALNKSLEAKDAYTSGHANRVKDYSVKLAELMKLPGYRIKNIETAAILHDIGKIGISDSILNKPGRLTDDEYGEIKRHPEIGSEILKDVIFLKDSAEIIKHHHERFDGKGYPDGLKGDEISIEASILAVADVYDAMTSNRAYRLSLGDEVATREIELNSGTQFNPIVATAFLKLLKSKKI